MTTPTTRQAAATQAANSATAAGSQPSTQAGSADVTLTAAVQMTTGSPYTTPLPPPGFPYLSAGYPPYWGMYPYPYPQYVPPMAALSLGGSLATMNAISSAPRTEQCPPRTPVEPIPDMPEAAPEPSSPPGEDLGLHADIYDDMSPLEGQEDSDEGSKIEVQGAVCAVAPVPKGRGYR